MTQLSELQIFRNYLQKRGLRYTPEREQIIKEIFSTHDHFDVDTLYLRMRQKGLQISKASIYRLIPLLIEAGLIEEVFFEEGHMHYEHIYGHEPHCHLRCTNCKRIEEFVDPHWSDIKTMLHERFGYDIINYKLEVQGLCPDCKKKVRDKKTN